MLQRLRRWRDAGWLRSLDLALARFVHETDPAAPPSLLLATALLAHLEGQGHAGLPLPALAADPAGTLGWPAPALAELREALAGAPPDAAARREAWGGCPTLEIDPLDEGGSSPLVLAGELLALRRYWRYESRISAQVRARSAAAADVVDTGAACRQLQRLFPAAGTEVDWQQVACAVALRGRLTLVTGGPGTGKTYTAARVLVLLQSLHRGAQPLRVALAAPTGKAAARLRQSIGQALHALRADLADGPAGDAGRDGAPSSTSAAPPPPALLPPTALSPAALPPTPPPASTLHALLGTRPGTRRFRHDAADPLPVDLLIVDEASMIHLEMMAALLEALPPRARLVLLGDRDQLASVEAGAVLGDLCQGAGSGGRDGGYRPDTVQWIRTLTGQELPVQTQGDGPALAQQTVVLRRSHRFEGPIGQLATAVNRGDASAALQLLQGAPGGPLALLEPRDAAGLLPLALHGRDGAVGGYGAYLQQLAQRPADGADPETFDDWARRVLRRFDDFRVLCALREGPWGVAGLNAAIERALVDARLLVRRGEWYEGRPVMVTRNDPALGVFNGDIGIVLRPPAGRGDALRVFFLDGEALRSVSVGRLADVETAFAMTVHKSQGSEFGHVALVLPDEDVPVLSRELVYTGITRARLAITLVARQPELLARASARLTRRVSGLRSMLDGA